MMTMKKFVALLVTLMMVFSFASLSLAETQTLTIGIIQFAEHGSLDNCRQGFIEGLAEEGFI